MLNVHAWGLWLAGLLKVCHGFAKNPRHRSGPSRASRASVRSKACGLNLSPRVAVHGVLRWEKVDRSERSVFFVKVWFLETISYHPSLFLGCQNLVLVWNDSKGVTHRQSLEGSIRALLCRCCSTESLELKESLSLFFHQWTSRDPPPDLIHFPKRHISALLTTTTVGKFRGSNFWRGSGRAQCWNGSILFKRRWAWGWSFERLTTIHITVELKRKVVLNLVGSNHTRKCFKEWFQI